MDALILARIQFAANISFHILFPTITIALGWFLLYLKIRYNRSLDMAWMQAYRFWVKIFALSFGVSPLDAVRRFPLARSTSIRPSGRGRNDVT